jgi:hypothetical protein
MLVPDMDTRSLANQRRKRLYIHKKLGRNELLVGDLCEELRITRATIYT